MIEHTDADELRIGPGAASIEDAGVLAGWLADRGVEVSFRVDGDLLRIDGLRDRLVEAREPADEPADEPRWRLQALVPDGRTADGWRATATEVELDELVGFLDADAARERPVRFQPVRVEQ